MPNDNSGPSNPSTSSAAAAPAKGGTRPKKDEASTLRDARTVLLAVKKHAKEFVAADKDKKEKRIDAKWIAKLDTTLKQGNKARGGQRARAVQAAGVTTQEIAARNAVYAAATLVRDDVATSPASGDALRRAFGVGAAAKSSTTSSVLGFADSIIAAYANEEWQPQAVKAGITPKKIAALQALREKLAAFDAQRTAQVNERVAGTQSKDATLASLRKLTAYARQVANVVFRDDPKALLDFASGTPRRTPKPRGSAKKPTAKPKKRARVAPPRRGRAKKKKG